MYVVCLNFKFPPLVELYWQNNSSLFDEFVCKLGLFWHAILKREWNERFKGPIYTRTSWIQRLFFCSTNPLKAPNRLKSLKLAWRFVLTSCDIYQNPLTQGKILKFWQCRKKKHFNLRNAVLLFRVERSRARDEFAFFRSKLCNT
jgi:hypothetical protein